MAIPAIPTQTGPVTPVVQAFKAMQAAEEAIGEADDEAAADAAYTAALESFESTPARSLNDMVLKSRTLWGAGPDSHQTPTAERVHQFLSELRKIAAQPERVGLASCAHRTGRPADIATLAQKGQGLASRIQVLLGALDNALQDAAFPAESEAERRDRCQAMDAAMVLSDLAKEQTDAAYAIAEQIEVAEFEWRHSRNVPAAN